MTNTLPSFNSSQLRRFKSVQTSSQPQFDENANYYNKKLELPSHEFLKVSFQHRLRTPPHKSVAEKILRYDDFTYTLIGEGFFAQVFKASSKPQTPNSVKSSKILALKRNKPNNPIEQNKNILRERLILEKLKHNNILKFEGVCLIDNQIHVFTEYVNGGSIANAIQNKGFSLVNSKKIILARDIAKALIYLHDKKIFHRDVTSRNCLIRMSPKCPDYDDLSSEAYNHPKYFDVSEAVLADFGLAEKIDENLNHAIVGTPFWMAPEVLNEKGYNQLADIFSLGIVLCELIARKSADPDELPRTNEFGLDTQAFKKLSKDSMCPKSLRKLAIKMCNIKPEKRPNLTDIVSKLTTILEKISNKKQPVFKFFKEKHSKNSNKIPTDDNLSSSCDSLVTKQKLLSRKTKLVDQPSKEILSYAANLPLSRRLSVEIKSEPLLEELEIDDEEFSEIQKKDRDTINLAISSKNRSRFRSVQPLVIQKEADLNMAGFEDMQIVDGSPASSDQLRDSF